MAEVRNRRRGLLIDKKLQGKMIGTAVVLLVAALVGFLVVGYASWSTKGVISQAPAGQASSAPLIGIAVVVLILILAIVWYGLHFSHRIVGPVFAFNRHLNWVREGNLTRDLKLRDGDEFQSLAQSFNAMQSSLRRRVREDLEAVERVQKLVTQLAEAAKAGDTNAASVFESMEKELAEVRRRQEGLLAS
ncbi:HAMP domain-containing protein [bacterium]|nr:HAMP domain-containing protein [bacterium]